MHTSIEQFGIFVVQQHSIGMVKWLLTVKYNCTKNVPMNDIKAIPRCLFMNVDITFDTSPTISSFLYLHRQVPSASNTVGKCTSS